MSYHKRPIGHRPGAISMKLARRLLCMLLRHRKIGLSWVATLLVFLFGAAHASGSGHPSEPALTYRTALGHDLDGDRLPETATIRHRANVYQVNIHFTTGRPKLRLTTDVPEGVAGLSVEFADVNQDGRDELVVVSATSVRPIAVWVNQGKARFQKVNSWTFGIGRYSGPKLQHRRPAHPELDCNISVDRMPQAALQSAYLSLANNLLAIPHCETCAVLIDSILGQLPPRGPPATRV
jgi:hypothetical protein